MLVPGGGKLEVLTTEVAGVRLLAGVSGQMSLKVVLLRELLAAVRALERLLTSVKLLMSKPVVPEREHLAAEGALLRLGLLTLLSEVSSLMLVALVAAGELLPAVRAQVTFEPDVNVSPVGFGPGKGLAADVALERVDAGVDGLPVDEHAAASGEDFLAIGASPVSQVIIGRDPGMSDLTIYKLQPVFEHH